MNGSDSPADVLIVGQGLAGSTLAWSLLDRGVRPLVIDRGGVDASGRPSASRVAAGLITPITGKRMTLDPRWDESYAAALEFYRGVERATGATLLNERPSLRVFASEEERACFDERCADSDFRRHARLAAGDEIPAALAAPFGAFVMPHAARLDTHSYLDATRRHLMSIDAFREAEIDANRSAEFGNRLTILCNGYTRTDEIAFKPAKGEVLTIEASGAAIDRVVHRGVWVAPEGGGRYRLGSTHAWDALDSAPTTAGREELLARFAEVCAAPVEVVEHHAAVRPTTADRQPIARLAPPPARLGRLNGLGTKGALWAPWLAGRLAGEIEARFAAEGSL